MSIIPQDAIPQKQCCTCKHSFPATVAYFHESYQERNPDGLNKRCRECANEQTRRSRANPNKKRLEKCPEGYKRCSECKELKPATHDYFHVSNNRGGYNLTHVCSQCWKPYTERLAKERAAKPQKPTRTCTGPCGRTLPATTEYFFSEGPGLCTRCKECRAKQYKPYQVEHKEERKAHRKVYDSANPEISRTYNRNRQARKKNAPGSHTKEDIQAQFKRQKGKCYYCGIKLGTGKRAYHIDHVVPLSRGGSNDISNLVVACHTCNERKQDKLLHEWIEGGRLL